MTKERKSGNSTARGKTTLHPSGSPEAAGKLLIVDADFDFRGRLESFLTGEGYEVSGVGGGEDTLGYFRTYDPDLVLLDVMNTDGFRLCREIRVVSAVPVIIITAKSDVIDKVLGLELGADDYIVKPFDPKEVAARVAAKLRRYFSSADRHEGAEIRFEDVEINRSSGELKIKGKRFALSPKEFELFCFLVVNRGRVLSKEEIMEKVWGCGGDSRTVHTHVKKIRDKLSGASDRWRIRTVWGAGYRFEVSE